MTYLPELPSGPVPKGVPSCSNRKTGRHIQTPKQRARIEWMLKDFDSFQSANRGKLCLGSLPKRAAKFGCANFDLEEEREYCGDDGVKISGGMLAGITAYIVRCGRDPIDYIFSLRDVPAKVIEPIKAFLRVKLAIGRLAAEMAKVKPDIQPCLLEVAHAASGDTGSRKNKAM